MNLMSRRLRIEMSKASALAGTARRIRLPKRKAGRVTASLTLAALAVGLASCGSSSASLASSQATTTTGVSPQARAAYQNCLSAHGFTFPKFNPNSKNPPTTVPAAVRNAAVAACEKLNPGGAGGRPGVAPSKAQQQALAAYTACLKSHGVSIPTTSSGSGPGGFRALAQSPGFASAAQACSSLRPKFGGGAGGSRTFPSQGSTTTTAAG